MRPAIAGSIAFGLALSLAAPTARADDPAATPAARARLSGYEKTSLDNALATVKGQLDPSPEGKIVESIETVRLDVFEKRDFIPEVFLGFVNWFHVTSKPYVIEREVLQTKGRRYDQALVDETERNLRNTRQVSLVLAAPMVGSAPDRVRLLVITKDIWSLRFNQDFRVAGGKLEHYLAEPAEENFLGTHQTVSARFEQTIGTLSFGGHYIVPRIAGSWINADASGGVIVNRTTGAAEGSYGELSYGQPLYSTKALWAWSSDIKWRGETVRRYVGSKLRTFDSKLTPIVEDIPYAYQSDTLSGHYDVTRSFGTTIKNDFKIGVLASRKVFRAPDNSRFGPVASADFVTQALPVSDTQIGPYFQIRSHSNRYITILDFETLGLQENFIRGHDAYLQLTPITTALGSSRSFLAVYAAAAYSVPLGDGLAKAYVELTHELTTSGVPDGSIDVGTRITSPRTPIGRLHFDARLLDRYANYLNAKSALGGDTRPRGYPSGAFIGRDVVAATLELRSRAAQILSCQLAGAAFFDSGDAFDGFDKMRLKQSAGFGLRVLFPQLDRVVLRVDWGFPLTKGVVPAGGFPGDIVFTFRQAFAVPALPVKD
ncbi:MAG: hypothetical protein ABJE95_27105 [Byssovorax sp.]